jgi:hypothetical protein
VLDELLLQSAVREIYTARDSLTDLVPVDRIGDVWPMAEIDTPRIGIHLSDRTPHKFDQGKVCAWDCLFGVVVEVHQSDLLELPSETIGAGDLLRMLVAEIEAASDGVALRIAGYRTNGLSIDRIAGVAIDTETQMMGRVVSVKTIVQPAG